VGKPQVVGVLRGHHRRLFGAASAAMSDALNGSVRLRVF
jgi:hypothetical protein